MPPDTALGYRYGLFGLVRSGWDLSAADFGRNPVTKDRHLWPDPRGAPVEQVEYVVSLLQREARDLIVQDATSLTQRLPVMLPRPRPLLNK